jgi:hypothetical protein
MSARRAILALLACASVLLAPASAFGAYSQGTPEQVAWVRRAATNFVSAELAGNAPSACAILNAPLRVTRNHRTCEQRWNARLTALLHTPGARRRLRAQRHAIVTAAVIVQGNLASLSLKTPLFKGPNRFLWSENCWMLEG